MNRISGEIGVDKKIFKTSLTERGVNFAIVEQGFLLMDTTISEDVRLKKICMALIPNARLGAAQLRLKFGDQPQIEECVFKMIDFQEAHIGIVDDPAEYRRNAMYQ